MWALPVDLAQLRVTLPEGLLLLPHHYTALDRERLLWLLRALMPECRQLAIEAASLDVFVRRNVTWPSGVVLVYGFAESTGVDAMRAAVAPLGARHALVQLPQPQLTGTGWMEPTLKVPLLRALERAWRDPAHPLRAIGIHEMPAREAAKYTDEPVEYLTIVQEALEHRLRNVLMEVTTRDWERSLDHALAARLRVRMGDGLPSVSIALVERDKGSKDDEGIDALTRCGLVVATNAGPRPSPLLAALTRPLVRTYAVSGARGETDLGWARAVELFHMASEVALVVSKLDAWVFDRARSHKLDRPPVELQARLANPHRWLEGSRADEAISRAILGLRDEASSARGIARDSARVLASYLKTLVTRGTSARDELDACLVDVRGARIDAAWYRRVVAMTLLVVASRLFVERSTAADLGEVRELLRTLDEKRSALAPRADHAAAVLAALVNMPPLAGRSLGRLVHCLLAIADGGPPTEESAHERPDNEWSKLDLPYRWIAVWYGDTALVLQHQGKPRDRQDPLTLADLHGDLVVGIAALAVGDLDLAMERARLVLDLSTRHEVPVLRAFARELMAAVHELRGKYDEAAQLLFRARSRYLALEDTARIEGVERRLTRMGIAFEPFAPKPRVRKTRR